ncbi:MAG: dimethyl sulfoxide reductase anchor subunit [Candidatus Omnitrophica bacterium]|nr:dimethyl sulfoxide reductase anchor subunit [Candidatus Omnitrophota bacterium]
MKKFDIIQLLDESDLPLKNRIDSKGYYAPERPSLIPAEPLAEGEQYRFHFDMSKCVGCQCCVVACNEQNNNPAEVNWRRVGEIEGGTYPDTKKFHLSMACNHCLDPSCLTGCPTEAYIKLENGIVKHQAEECIGCGYCSWNCPYGVPQFNPDRRIVTKCDMCHGRLKEGQLPACIAACPEEAIQIEKVNVAEWRANHTQADAPHVPDSGITISTTRITLPPDVPATMLRANRHRIEPEQPHTSLIFMTVLTQLAVGGFLTLWLGELLSRRVAFLAPLRDFLAYGSMGMLSVTGLALFAAVFHLGRPVYAYKALRMWKRSWLSREVLSFAVFSHLGGAYALLELARHFWNWPIPRLGMDGLGAGVVISGLYGVYASAKIYLVPARPAWNTVRTPLRFFLTGFMLGPAFALALYGLCGSVAAGPALSFLAVSAAAGLLQLAVLLSRLFSLQAAASDEMYASSFLLIHRFRKLFLARLALLTLGSFVFPLILTLGLRDGEAGRWACVALSLLSFAFSLAGEFAGRYLFFVTVVPKNMPGSFFTKGGAH